MDANFHRHAPEYAVYPAAYDKALVKKEELLLAGDVKLDTKKTYDTQEAIKRHRMP